MVLSPVIMLANNGDIDSTLQHHNLLPLPLKNMPLVTSKKISLPHLKNTFPHHANFFIANPSQQQISDWLSGNFNSLNQIFSASDPKTKTEMMADTSTFIAKARKVIGDVKDIGNFVSTLTGGDLQTLPVGMKKSLGDNTAVTIGISNIYLYPEYASLEIYVEVIAPNFANPLFFAAPDVKFSRLGGISGTVSLGLLGNFTLPVFEDKATIMLRAAVIDPVEDAFKKGQGTYAEFSCDGIETISIDANLAISRQVLVPVEEQNPTPAQIDTTKTVNANFFISTSNGLSDIITEINFEQPFYHAKSQKLIWTIESAVLDFSTLQHRNSLRFPVGNYDPTQTLASKENWQGVYIKRIGVEWREDFTKDANGNGSAFEINATNIIIDEAGFTGRIAVENLLPLSDNHQIDKWAFSINHLDVSILTNTFESLDFAGHLGMPITNPEDDSSLTEQDLIAYSGSFNFVEDIYSISGNLPTDKVLPLKMFKGQVVIENTSTFTIGYENDNVFLRADLNADFEVTGGQDADDDKKLVVPLVEVNGLRVSSRSPFLISPGSWTLKDTITVANFAGFGLNISTLMIQKNSQTMEPELIVGADINLAAGDKVNISGATIVRVIGEIKNESTKQRWKFKKVKLDMIQVAVDLEAFSISGRVVFFENLDGPTSNGQIGYGSGFQGNADLRIKGLNKDGEGSSGFSAMALFGTATGAQNNSFRYFMVDVKASFSTGIPLGPIGLYGVGGGVYYRMEQENTNSNFNNATAFSPPSSSNVDSYTEYISGFLGESLSGRKYRPSGTVKIGINLNVILGSIPSPKAFNTNIGLAMEFNNNGGLNFIRLEGILNVMTDISMDGPSCSGVSLAIEMEFVFKTRAGRDRTGFYASAHAFVKVGPLKGASENIPAQFASYISRCSGSDLGYAGGLEMQFSKNYWFLNVGEPDNRLALGIDLWELGAIELETYFDIGKNIPPFPGLPTNVQSLTGMGNLLQNETTRGSGQGFAFGVSFKAGMDTPKFLGFSAHVHLGAGFDIMLNKFRDVNCMNSGSAEPIGINNWYAAGQAWAYIDASVKFKNTEVLGLGLAAALQIKGPNPTFGRGALAGRVRLGPFRKKFSVHFKFGEECEVQGAQELEPEIQIVLFMTPSNDDQFMEVTTPIDIVFAQELNKNFPVLNPNTDENENFRIRLETFEITDPEGNQVSVNQEQVSGQFLRCLPIDQLKSNTEYTLTLVATLVRENGALVEREERIHIFKTGKLPTEILKSNIDFALPGDGQFNFYKLDNSSQYIQLLQGQDELLADLPEDQSLKIKISTTHPTSISYKNCSYDAGMNRLNYVISSGLINGKSYKLEVVRVPDEAFSEFEDSDDYDLDEFNLPIPFEHEAVVYTMAFRVSNYNKFEDKMSAIEFSDFQTPDSNSPRFINVDYAKPHRIDVSNLSEPFGVKEVEGIYNNDPSLVFEAILNSTLWITDEYRNFSGQEISGLDIYGYSQGERMTDYLDEDRVAYLGNREPDKGITIIQDSVYQLKLANIYTHNNNTEFSNINIEIDYGLGRIMYKELNSVFDFLRETELGSFSTFSMIEFSEFQGPGSNDCSLNDITIDELEECCMYDNYVYQALVTYTEHKLATLPSTMAKFIYAPVNRSNFCAWDMDIFTKRNLFTDLTPGDYPVIIKYYKPTSSTPLKTFNRTFIKN